MQVKCLSLLCWTITQLYPSFVAALLGKFTRYMRIMCSILAGCPRESGLQGAHKEEQVLLLWLVMSVTPLGLWNSSFLLRVHFLSLTILCCLSSRCWIGRRLLFSFKRKISQIWETFSIPCMKRGIWHATEAKNCMEAFDLAWDSQHLWLVSHDPTLDGYNQISQTRVA